MVSNIKKKITRLEARIDKLLKEKDQIQEVECQHMNITRTAKANTGNWCPADDHYWYEFKCYDCGKFWSEDQGVYNDRMREEKWVWEKARKINKV